MQAEIKITDIKYLSFSLAPIVELQKNKVPVEVLVKNPNIDDVIYTTDAKFEIKAHSNKILFIINVVGTYKSGRKSTLLLTSETLCEFEIINFDEVITSSKGKINAPEGFFPIIYGLGYSTARGMLSVKLAGTYLEKAILPMTNPTEVMAKNMKVSAGKKKSDKKKTVKK